MNNMKRKGNYILLLLSINLILSGQNNFSGSFSNSNYYETKIGRNSCDVTFRLFEDSTFTYLEHHFHLDCISDYYSYGRYSIEDDTIVLRSVMNDPSVKVLDKFSIKHKNSGILWIMDYNWKDISEIKLFRENKIIMTDTVLGHFTFFLDSDIRERKKISIEIEIPSNIEKYYADSTLIFPNRFTVFQEYRGNTYRGDINRNDSLYIWDVDSSLTIVRANNYYTTDTIIVYGKKNIHSKLKYNNINLPSPNQYNNSINHYILPDKIGKTRKDYVLKKSTLSYKNCTKLLLRSDFFNKNRISLSDSLKISFNVTQLFELMNSLGSGYTSEILDDNLNSDVFLKSKKNPDFYVSKPAFTKDKIFAIVRVNKIDCDYDRYYLFERRKYDYVLIGELTNKIKSVNASMFIMI